MIRTLESLGRGIGWEIRPYTKEQYEEILPLIEDIGQKFPDDFGPADEPKPRKSLPDKAEATH
jgi:hypothetical protein